MSLLLKDGSFPPVQTSAQVTNDERTSAIEYVNRVNLFFEENDHDKMTNAWVPHGVVYHFLGTIRGHADIREIFKTKYEYLVPGVSRSATNHVIERDEETGGVYVRYHELLIRYAWPKDSGKLHVDSGPVGESISNDGLPKVYMFTHIADRLVQTDEGWKIYERYLGATTTDASLNQVN